jgi:hypothetical protein
MLSTLTVTAQMTEYGMSVKVSQALKPKLLAMAGVRTSELTEL